MNFKEYLLSRYKSTSLLFRLASEDGAPQVNDVDSWQDYVRAKTGCVCGYGGVIRELNISHILYFARGCEHS